MEYIEIDADSIPYRFDITLLDKTYTFYINHNYLYNFLTVDLYKDDIALVVGEEIIYGEPLFQNAHYKDIPGVNIVPLDLSGVEDTVTIDNINKEVFLFLQGGNI